MSRHRLPGVRRVVAVASGKGGVGKTTVTAHLGLALGATHRVGIFDADIYGPNIPTIFGVRSQTRGENWLPMARRDATPYLNPIVRSGVKIMSLGLLIPEGRAARPDPRFIGQLVLQTVKDVRWGELDYLLLDLPPGTGEPQRTLLEGLEIDGFIIVTTASSLALADAEREVDWLSREGGTVLGVVDNMSETRCPACGASVRLFEGSVADSPVLGTLPLAQSLPWATDLNGVAGQDSSPPARLKPLADWLVARLP